MTSYLPLMLIFCNQSNRGIISRYVGTWIVKDGMLAYQTVADISGFDFYGFLVAHREEYRAMVRRALQRIVE